MTRDSIKADYSLRRPGITTGDIFRLEALFNVVGKCIFIAPVIDRIRTRQTPFYPGDWQLIGNWPATE